MNFMKTFTPALAIIICILATVHLSNAQVPVTVTLIPDNCSIGMERSGAPDIPAPAEPNFSSYSWTCGGYPCIGRTLMSTDLSALPANITVIDARLSLYADPACTYLGYFGQPTYGGNNRSVIRRVTGAWDPNTVTWNNQPSITKVHQVYLHSSQSDVQDYLNLDVTKMIQDMINNPSSNHGILLQMNDEFNHYKSMIFGSCLHPDENLRPKFVITYVEGGSGKTAGAESTPWEVEVSPNPAADHVSFEFTDFESGDAITLSLYNISGQLVHRENTTASALLELNVSLWNTGMYFFSAENKTTRAVCVGKFVKQ
jgi:hypothetical protein